MPKALVLSPNAATKPTQLEKNIGAVIRGQMSCLFLQDVYDLTVHVWIAMH